MLHYMVHKRLRPKRFVGQIAALKKKETRSKSDSMCGRFVCDNLYLIVKELNELNFFYDFFRKNAVFCQQNLNIIRSYLQNQMTQNRLTTLLKIGNMIHYKTRLRQPKTKFPRHDGIMGLLYYSMMKKNLWLYI